MKKTAQFLASIFALGLVACSDGNKTAGGVSIEENTVAEGVSSSSVQPVSSSSVEQAVSSANVVEDPMSSDASTVIVVPVPSHDEIVEPVVLWDGTAGEYKVNTESDESGYWYIWGDDEEGGTSRIELPVDPGNEYSGDSYDPLIDHCGGFCGTVEFGTSIPDPSVGVAFNVADIGKTADISEWHGLCVAYSSELLFDIYLASELGDGTDAVVVSRVEIPSATDSIACVSWQDFALESSAVENTAEAAKKARALGFEFKGEPGKKGFFNIKSITTYNESLRPLPDSN